MGVVEEYVGGPRVVGNGWAVEEEPTRVDALSGPGPRSSLSSFSSLVPRPFTTPLPLGLDGEGHLGAEEDSSSSPFRRGKKRVSSSSSSETDCKDLDDWGSLLDEEEGDALPCPSLPGPLVRVEGCRGPGLLGLREEPAGLRR